MRKFYYIKPNIQHSFTSFFAIVTSIELMIFGLVFLMANYLEGQFSHDMVVYVRFGIFLFLLLIFSGINFWLGTRLSHRIVGPLVQIQRVLDQAIKGEFKSRIRLRASDYLHEVGDRINVFLEQLENDSLPHRQADSPQRKSVPLSDNLSIDKNENRNKAVFPID